MSFTDQIPSLSRGVASTVKARIDALEAGAGTGGEYCLYRTTDLSKTNNTLAPDPVLTFPVAANEVWEVKAVLFASSASATPDINVVLNGPTGSTGIQGAHGADSTTSNTSSSNFYSTSITTMTGNASGFAIGVPGTGAAEKITIDSVLIVGSTAGSCSLDWAQVSTNVTATTLRAGSFIRARRISPIQPAGANYGAMQLVQRQELTAAATSVTFTGLDLDSDYTYIVEFAIANTSASTANYYMYFNGDTTAGNYHYQQIAGTNNTTNGAEVANALVTNIAAACYAAGSIEVNKPAGASSVLSRASVNTFVSTTNLTVHLAGHLWKNAANPTQITFTADIASAIGIGSYFNIYRLAPVPLAIGALKNFAFKRKTADETRTSTAALADDTTLTFPIGANETWEFDLLMLASGAGAGDIQWAISVPSGATGEWGHTGSSTGAGGNTDTNTTALQGFGDSNNFAAGVSGTLSVILTLNSWGTVVNGSTAGSVTVRWAQLVSNATGTILRSGSKLVGRRVA